MDGRPTTQSGFVTQLREPLAAMLVYVLVPMPWKLTAVCAVPLICYGDSLVYLK